jgi:glucose-1-phosphate cytidylyltransferase
LKAVIFAGGYGTRLAELTSDIPKPLVPIGGMPILWHIMKYYSQFNVSEFVILAGYKSNLILDFFQRFQSPSFDIEISTADGQMNVYSTDREDWKVRIVDTGEDTLTGSRLYRARSVIDDGEDFFLTYGDGLANVDLNGLRTAHNESKNIVTLTAVTPPDRFGVLELDTGSEKVLSFEEKPKHDKHVINGGFFVVSQKVFEQKFTETQTVWETDILTNLCSEGKLGYFRHDGFWQSMDTLRDKENLQKKWHNNFCPWKNW